MAAPLALPPSPRIVLDSNAVLALWVFRDPALAVLREAVEAGRFELWSREDCLHELTHVFAYPHLKLDEAAQAEALATYTARVRLAPATPAELVLPRCRDEDDQKFIEAAWLAEAHLLVSRDKAVLRVGRHRLLRDRFTVLTPETLDAQLRDAAPA
ncbi:putative toxin-antitoxin system toxin component, PIN family [Niveibacterium sp. SC-1]|uniref:putative toxin-antitoxin system toxin component, PIN family n=1 Tax=Niveibacterium sp. SC-1 TaxID=3135646 RepID=UPI00311F5FCF